MEFGKLNRWGGVRRLGCCVSGVGVGVGVDGTGWDEVGRDGNDVGLDQIVVGWDGVGCRGVGWSLT